MQNASKEHLFGNSRAGKRLKKEVNRNCLNAVWNIKQYHYVAILSVLCKDTCLKLKSGFDQCVVKKLQTFFFLRSSTRLSPDIFCVKCSFVSYF